MFHSTHPAEECPGAGHFQRMCCLASRHSHCDPVTGLPDLRQLLLDSEHGSLASGQSRLVIVIHLHDNQTYPASVGLPYAALRETARRLRQGLARLGQLYHVQERDFCVQLPYDTTLQQDAVHQELFHGLATLIADCITGHSPAIGLATCADATQPVQGLLHKATHAAGMALRRNSLWAVYDEAQDLAQRRALGLIKDFDLALGTGEVYLEYQPRFSLQTGRMLSAEALIVWQHPRLGKLSPAEFIPLIEGSGKISHLTRWVINRALHDLACCIDSGVRIALNLSPLDFESMNVAHTLQAACQHQGIAPCRLEVEITEGEWIRDNPQVIAQLSAIRDMGVDVAIDDFGTGYANFAYLQEIPANVLKVDQSLITDLEHSPRNRTIAHSVFQLAQELGYRTVAEGIETFRCLSLVRAFGCDEAQGYFMSRPLEFERFKRHCGDVPLAFRPIEVTRQPSTA